MENNYTKELEEIYESLYKILLKSRYGKNADEIKPAHTGEKLSREEMEQICALSTVDQSIKDEILAKYDDKDKED